MRQHWDRSRVVAVALGGSLGATARWVVVSSFDRDGFPWPVLAVNVVGSLLLGIVLAEEWTHPKRRLLLHDFGGIGLCGGLTTFSTFSVEVVDLARAGDVFTASAYAATSVVTTIAAVVLGAAALQRTRALTTPLEGQP